MKLYHVETQEDYDALMNELDEQGYKWRGGSSLKGENGWEFFGKETVILVQSLEEVRYSDKNCYTNVYPNEEIITYKAPKNEKTLGIPSWADTKKEVASEQSDPVNKPNHYVGIQGLEVETVLQNFIPRYTDSYEAHRIASAIEYLLRSPLKNGTEDVKKAKKNIEQVLSYRETQNE